MANDLKRQLTLNPNLGLRALLPNVIPPPSHACSLSHSTAMDEDDSVLEFIFAKITGPQITLSCQFGNYHPPDCPRKEMSLEGDIATSLWYTFCRFRVFLG